MGRARYDGNLNPTLIGVLNTDGVTPQEVYVNSDHETLVNITGQLNPVVDYDLLTVTNLSATSDELEFSLSATPVRTITITYADASVPKVSDDIASVGFA